MPRVISDELYDQLMGCVKQQRLLGVMGMLENMRDESVPVCESTGDYYLGPQNYGLPGYQIAERTWTEDADAQSTDKN